MIDFYIKRIKKLFPALIFYVLLTSLLISFVNQNPIDELRTGIASLMGLTNIFLAYTSGDYFQVSTKLNPFLHTWYLSLITQFYIIFPLIFLLTGFARKKKNSFKNFALIIVLISSISLFYFYMILMRIEIWLITC